VFYIFTRDWVFHSIAPAIKVVPRFPSYIVDWFLLLLPSSIFALPWFEVMVVSGYQEDSSITGMTAKAGRLENDEDDDDDRTRLQAGYIRLAEVVRNLTRTDKERSWCGFTHQMVISSSTFNTSNCESHEVLEVCSAVYRLRTAWVYCQKPAEIN
jgi:hypothetical protein